MEIATTVKAIEALLTLGALVVTVVQSIRAKKYGKAWGESENALEAIAIALEIFPQGEGVKRLKKTIQSVTTHMGATQMKVHQIAKKFEQLAQESGLTGAGNSAQTIAEAARVVKAARASRKPKVVKHTTIMMGFVFVAMAISCAMPRQTSEIVFPPTVHDPGEIVIVWPLGVDGDDVYTTTSGRLTFSSAPLLQTAAERGTLPQGAP